MHLIKCEYGMLKQMEKSEFEAIYVSYTKPGQTCQ